jgi:DNA (cytosine-5)-methyltransferase 1
MDENKKHTVAGLFSGCGGLDLGFINAGFDVVWANDFFREAVETCK